ncbi:hypothetical protein AN641_06690 [Candidatus Epulonipiscioides gigas]|nr:hypothetical protein AN641_06690 [Epulopiscium sp. SCG-C07WGA-EpuloA2]
MEEKTELPKRLNIIVDRTGAEIEIKDNYERIVSYAPSITEMLVDLGYGDKIVAITNFDTATGVESNPMIFDMINPDIEALIALEPDLIISSELTAEGGADPLAELRKLGVTVTTIPTATTINDIYIDLEFMGILLGEKETVELLIQDMKNQIAEISAITNLIEDRKSVYFEISPAPYMYSTGSGTYLNEMITIAGGDNILSDLDNWVSVTDEMVISKNPDIIFTNVTYVENPIEEIKDRNGWANITAVKDNQVFGIENNPTSLPTRNIITGIKEMTKSMYPDLEIF